MQTTMSRKERDLKKKLDGQEKVTLSADMLIGLVRDIETLKAKVLELQTEVRKNFDTMVEYIPCHVDEGLQFKAFSLDDNDGYSRITLPLPKSAVREW